MKIEIWIGISEEVQRYIFRHTGEWVLPAHSWVVDTKALDAETRAHLLRMCKYDGMTYTFEGFGCERSFDEDEYPVPITASQYTIERECRLVNCELYRLPLSPDEFDDQLTLNALLARFGLNGECEEDYELDEVVRAVIRSDATRMQVALDEIR